MPAAVQHILYSPPMCKSKARPVGGGKQGLAADFSGVSQRGHNPSLAAASYNQQMGPKNFPPTSGGLIYCMPPCMPRRLYLSGHTTLATNQCLGVTCSVAMTSRAEWRRRAIQNR